MGEGGREREKKKTVSEEGTVETTAETEHIMARRVPHCAIVASAQRAGVKRKGKGGSFPGTLAGKGRVGDG